MVDKWVEYINARHISLPNHAEGPRQQHSWKPTYRQEIYLFFGILIYMSHTRVPSLQEYWETSLADALHPISRFMLRTQFLQLYRRFYT
jgi:hypothetical protein